MILYCALFLHNQFSCMQDICSITPCNLEASICSLVAYSHEPNALKKERKVINVGATFAGNKKNGRWCFQSVKHDVWAST